MSEKSIIARHPHEPEEQWLLLRALRHPGPAIEFLRFRLGFDSLRSWYYFALYKQMLQAEEGWSPFGNYYEFGVGWGGTLTKYIKALKAFCRHYKKDLYQFHIFGFDSFEGLPEKENPKDSHPMWYAKAFSHSLFEIEQKVSKQGIDLRRGTVHFIRGFFGKTLTPALRDELKKWPPSIVTIDVDYYSSTKIVLEWLRPTLMSGTLFYFDDIWSFHGNPYYGALAAINEFNESGEGQLRPFPVLGMISKAYIYSMRDFEYKGRSDSLTNRRPQERTMPNQ